MLTERAPRLCQVPLVKSRMPLALSNAGVPLPAKVPWFRRLPLTCKAPPASRYVPLLPIDRPDTVFVPPVCWNEAVPPGA